jgi:hypothetical protein
MYQLGFDFQAVPPTLAAVLHNRAAASATWRIHQEQASPNHHARRYGTSDPDELRRFRVGRCNTDRCDWESRLLHANNLKREIGLSSENQGVGTCT